MSAAPSAAVWRGTKVESIDLLAALSRNCTCTFSGEVQARTSVCPGHAALLTEQKWLDWCLFLRRNVDSARLSEWPLPDRPPAGAP